MTSDLLPVVKAKVLTCTACWLHTAGSGPVPYRGPSPAPILVIGEAPGDDEDRERKPFIGRAGKLIQSMLKDVGINPDKHVAFCNVVSCWPGRHKKGYRTPAADEIAACHTNLLLQVQAADPEITILLGATALNAFRPDLKITKDRGRPMVIPELGGLVVPSFHPSACLRVHHLKPLLLKDLKQVRWRWKKDKGEGFGRWPEDCRVCHGEVEVYDEHGVAWCRKHSPNGAGKVEAVPVAMDLEGT